MDQETYLGQRLRTGEIVERLELGCIQRQAFELELLQEGFIFLGQVADVLTVEDQVLKLQISTEQS